MKTARWRTVCAARVGATADAGTYALLEEIRAETASIVRISYLLSKRYIYFEVAEGIIGRTKPALVRWLSVGLHE